MINTIEQLMLKKLRANPRNCKPLWILEATLNDTQSKGNPDDKL